MFSHPNDFLNEAVDMIGLGARHLRDQGLSVEDVQNELRDVVAGIQYFIATLEQHV